MLGHDGPPTNFYTVNLVTGERLARCPLRTLQLAREHEPELSRELDRYVDLYYPAYKEGHLLEAGGITDQPARYVELVRVIADMELTVEAQHTKIAKENDG